MSDKSGLPKPARDPDARLGIRLFLTKYPILTQAILETPLGDRADRMISLATLGLIVERNDIAPYGAISTSTMNAYPINLPREQEDNENHTLSRLSKKFTSALVEQLEED